MFFGDLLRFLGEAVRVSGAALCLGNFGNGEGHAFMHVTQLSDIFFMMSLMLCHSA